MTKKILSVLLAVVMVLAMGTVALVSVSADLTDLPEKEEGMNRYYFYMPDAFLNDFTAETGNTAGIYIWEGSLVTSAWPGDPATAADYPGVYYVDCPTDVTTIIWNNYLDGGADPTNQPLYGSAIQTVNIGTEYYDAGESDLYPDGTDSFDGMIYVTDYANISYNDYSKKMTFGGEWYYYYGNGEYGTSPVKGESEVYNQPAMNMELGLPTDTGVEEETTPDETIPTDTTVTDPAEDTTVTEPDVTETEATDPADPVANVTVAGETKTYAVGTTISYTVNLTAAELFENVQAIVTYDAEKLELVRKGNDDVYEEEIACPALGDAIFNADVEGVVKFNASKVKGYNFKEESVLVTLDFVVKAEGDAAISTLIEEMTIKGDGTQSYFTGGQPVITEGISVVEVLAGEEYVKPTEPVTTAPVDDEDDTTTAPADDDETVPTAGTDVQGTTDAATTGDDETVETGAATYIYIALAMIAMAACAVVVLRKKVNG